MGVGSQEGTNGCGVSGRHAVPEPTIETPLCLGENQQHLGHVARTTLVCGLHGGRHLGGRHLGRCSLKGEALKVEGPGPRLRSTSPPTTISWMTSRVEKEWTSIFLEGVIGSKVPVEDSLSFPPVQRWRLHWPQDGGTPLWTGDVLLWGVCGCRGGAPGSGDIAISS